MKREELISILEEKLPSMKLTYKTKFQGEIDKSVERDWLYEDEPYGNLFSEKWQTLPEFIPRDYLVGIQEIYDGRMFMSVPKHDGKFRLVRLEVMDFSNWGNTHAYGTLSIDGLYWKGEDGKILLVSTDLSEKQPLVCPLWKTELRHIIRKEDGFGDKFGYEVGESTGRFTFYNELILTAAYVSLIRVDGPFICSDDIYSSKPNEESIIVSVDENDNVTIGNKLKSYI